MAKQVKKKSTVWWKRESFWEMFSGVVLLGFLFYIGIYVGQCNTTKKFQRDAVGNGYGEFYLDEDSEKQFRWFLCEPIKKVNKKKK